MALLTLADCQSLPQIATDDTALSAAIDAAEGLAGNVCGYALALTSYTERKNVGVDQDTIVLRAAPVVIDGTHTFTITEGYTSPQTLTRGTAYNVGQETGVVERIDGAVFAEGRRALTATYSAGYTAATLPEGLKHALVELVGWVLGNTGNRGAKQERMDGYSATYDDLIHGVPASIASALQPYQRGGVG